MKKIIIFALIFMLNLSLVNADILPDYPKDTHEVEIKNIIENIDDYPDYIFFKTYYSIY
jgi:hypothetical protein